MPLSCTSMKRCLSSECTDWPRLDDLIGLELMNRLVSETIAGRLHMAVFHASPGPEGKQEAFNHSFGSVSISLRATSYLECHFGGFSAFFKHLWNTEVTLCLESLSSTFTTRQPQRLIHTSPGHRIDGVYLIHTSPGTSSIQLLYSTE